MFNMPAGATMSSITRKPGTYEEEVSFVIKEGQYTIAKIGKAPIINVRGGVIRGDDAAAMVAMFSFNDMPFKYDTWFNYYSMYGRTAIDRLLKQESILFDFIDTSCNTIQQCRITNRLADLARNYSVICSEYLSWEEHDYYRVKGSVYDECGTDNEKLWSSLYV